jgi:hypothetical protein
MLFSEYAIEPSVVGTWERFRYYKDTCGWGTGRLLAVYPGGWADQAMLACVEKQEIKRASILAHLEAMKVRRTASEGTHSAAAPDSHPPKAAVPAGHPAFADRCVLRPDAPYVNDRCWTCNAVREGARRPFRMIVSSGRRKVCAAEVVSDDQVDVDDCPAWIALPELVNRDAQAMADAIGLLLSCSSKVIVVDPHFDPSKNYFARPYYAMVERT